MQIRNDMQTLAEAGERWQKVAASRMPGRPKARDFIDLMFDDFIELKGDRQYGDDGAVVAGIAYLDNMPVTVIGQHKGRNFAESMDAHFGMPHPEGYRKSLRLMREAEKFRRPVVCIIDTPGAYPGIDAEARGQGAAIAANLLELSHLKTPVIGIIIGEGGSGGALALAMGDHLIMLENTYFSVISPEGCASILWKDTSLAPRAAESLKPTAADLKKMGIADSIIKEPQNLTNENMGRVVRELRRQVYRVAHKLMLLTPEELIERRWKRYSSMAGQGA